MEVFYSLAEATAIVEMWRQSYNNERPHSSLGIRPRLNSLLPGV